MRRVPGEDARSVNHRLWASQWWRWPHWEDRMRGWGGGGGDYLGYLRASLGQPLTLLCRQGHRTPEDMVASGVPQGAVNLSPAAGACEFIGLPTQRPDGTSRWAQT